MGSGQKHQLLVFSGNGSNLIKLEDEVSARCKADRWLDSSIGQVLAWLVKGTGYYNSRSIFLFHLFDKIKLCHGHTLQAVDRKQYTPAGFPLNFETEGTLA